MSIAGVPHALGSNVYRYDLTGNFSVGSFVASILPDSFADRAGNTDAGQTQQFTVLLPTQIVDDGDANFTTVGVWTQYTTSGFGSDFRYNAAGSGKDVASWTFQVPPGQYLVSTTWLAASNRASNAPYTIYDGDQAIGTVRVNQRTSPSGLSDQGKSWTNLNYAGNQGVFTITSGRLTVRLSDAANGYAIADAVRVQQVSVDAARIASDTIRPTADLANPGTSASIAMAQINGRKYLDLSIRDTGGAGLNETTILDSAAELTLSGAAAAGVSINGTPQSLGNGTYRYTLLGNFVAGPRDGQRRGRQLCRLGGKRQSRIERILHRPHARAVRQRRQRGVQRDRCLDADDQRRIWR